MNGAATAGGDWIEEKIAQRHQSVRLRLMRELHQRHKDQRRKRRDLARVLLAATLLVLGVVMVEFGRKTHVFSAASPQIGRLNG